MHLQLAALANQLPNDPVGALQRVHDVQKLTAQLDKDLDFYTWELRPGVLYNLGLVAALTDFVAAFSHAHDLPVAFECLHVPEARLQQHLEINLYRIAQEALNNIYEHARATAADVLLQHVDGRVVLTVNDNGHGFDLASVGFGGPDRGLGLVGMRERAALIEGTLEIESAAQQGTTVIVSAPLRLADLPDSTEAAKK